MSYNNYTRVPNLVFDILLCTLGYAELKVLLVIIRQTYGWKDKQTGTHKQFDWISGQFFSKKTGLSKRAVSESISKLIEKNLITVANKKGTVLTAEARRNSSKLYFSCNFKTSYDVTDTKPMTLRRTTIYKHTKLYHDVTS